MNSGIGSEALWDIASVELKDITTVVMMAAQRGEVMAGLSVSSRED